MLDLVEILVHCFVGLISKVKSFEKWPLGCFAAEDGRRSLSRQVLTLYDNERALSSQLDHYSF